MRQSQLPPPGRATQSRHRVLFYCLIAADDALGAITPIVAQRVRAPHFRPLRPILVPWPRIEIAERLVLHLVHLAEELDAHLVGVAMIDRDIVPDDVAARAPDQMDVVAGGRFL